MYVVTRIASNLYTDPKDDVGAAYCTGMKLNAMTLNTQYEMNNLIQAASD